MQLHKKNFSKKIARKAAPILSQIIVTCRLSVFVRQLIAFLNYCLGRGAGTGWDLNAEVDVAVHSILRKDPIVFDVGGNLGCWSQIFRQRISRGKLFIFEPQEACQSAIRKKNIRGSELICAAVGKEKSTMNLYSSSETDGSASLHERGDSFFTENVYEEKVVDVISLDDFAIENGLTFIDYAKFDIEGHELFALEGFQTFISSGKVGAFSFEFGSGNLNSKTTFRNFWDFLHENYLIYIITPSGKLEIIEQYYEDLEFYRGVSNFIARLKKESNKILR